MKVELFLFIDRFGQLQSVETNVEKAANKHVGGCVCLNVKVDVPDEYFVTPIFTTSVSLPPPKNSTGEDVTNTLVDWVEDNRDKKIKKELEDKDDRKKHPMFLKPAISDDDMVTF